MIATVRIAPIEHWCEESLANVGDEKALPKIVGRMTPINISAIHASPWCSGRAWIVPREFVIALRAEVEEFPMPAEDIIFACEHMLEMD